MSTTAAAEYDRTWDGLKLAPGAENEPGALGRMVRSGRTIRTPTFTVDAGKVFYLVKGAGMVYAAVDSHVMIAGPLHGQLVGDIPAGDSFHWVGHRPDAVQGPPRPPGIHRRRRRRDSPWPASSRPTPPPAGRSAQSRPA